MLKNTVLEIKGSGEEAYYWTATMLNLTLMTDENGFHIDTPQKTPWKKEAKYGWMNNSSKQLPNPNKIIGEPRPKTKYSSRSIDAIIIAPTVKQCRTWVKLLNYKPVNTQRLTPATYRIILQNRIPDEDIPVYLCGSWLDEDEFLGEDIELQECKIFLRERGFEFIEVTEIGKDNP